MLSCQGSLISKWEQYYVQVIIDVFCFVSYTGDFIEFILPRQLVLVPTNKLYLVFT